MKKQLLLFILITLTIFNALGQKRTAAQKWLYKAQLAKATKDTAKAYRYALKAIDEYPPLPEAYTTLGLWYFDNKQYADAAQIFAQAASRFQQQGKSSFALPAARAYILAEKPDSGLYWLSHYPYQNEETKAIAEKARALAKLSRPLDTNKVQRLSIRVNSTQAEFFPSWSIDGQKLYFTRRINGVNEDFYYADWDSCGDWFTARNIGSPPNTPKQESAFTVTADNHYLVYMRSDNRSENGWGRGGCDLYLGYRKAADSPWTIAQSFGPTINTPAFEGMASLSPDINDMYFVSDRPGGQGGLDIWVAHFTAGLWQLPINLGPAINTAEDDFAPFIASDGNTLYFASKGHIGLGGTDLFMARKINDSTWTAPENLGIPINSSADEYSIHVAPNGKDALFASDRGKLGGDMDIFQTTLPKSLMPVPTAYIFSSIYDSLSNSPALLGSVNLYNAKEQLVAQYHANKGDGTLLMSLPLGETFKYEARGFNYRISEGLLKVDSGGSYNFSLLPNSYKKPTKDSLIARIHFPKNVTSLSDSQKAALDSSIAYWQSKKEISFSVNSYTDNTGTPLLNIEKSTERALAVEAELVKSGIAEGIISLYGFGEDLPLVPNDSPENQDTNRRVEIVVTY